MLRNNLFFISFFSQNLYLVVYAMMDYGTPGEMHKMLSSWNGTWNVETTIWAMKAKHRKSQPALPLTA